jgi:hypothetical protein
VADRVENRRDQRAQMRVVVDDEYRAAVDVPLPIVELLFM